MFTVMKLLRVALSLAILTVVAVPANAQVPPENAHTASLGTDFGAANSFLPHVSIRTIEITSAPEAATITGTATILNRSGQLLGDLRLQLALLEPLPEIAPNTVVQDVSPLYDQRILNDEIRLTEQEERVVPFSYTPPSVPAGEWRLQVGIINTNGQRLGYTDSAVTLPGSESGFALFGNGGVLPDGAAETFEPLTGPVVAPGSTVTLTYRLKNIGSQPLTGTPTLTTYTVSATGEQVNQETAPAVTLAPGTEQEGSFTTTVATSPEPYYATLVLRDGTGQRISSVADFRWVVSGISGKILDASFNKITDTQAIALVDLAGPADLQTTVTAHLHAQLLDNAGIVTEAASDPIALGPDFIESVEIGFPIEGQLQSPGLRLTLVTADGAVLDTFEVHTAAPLPVADHQSRAVLWGVIGIAALALLLAIVYLLRHRRGSTSPPGDTSVAPTALAVLVALGLIGSATALQHVQAQPTTEGVYFHYSAGSVFGIYGIIDEPFHNGTYADPTSITTRFTLYRGHCTNVWDRGDVYIWNKKDGGKVPIDDFSIGGWSCHGGGSQYLNFIDPPASAFELATQHSFGGTTCNFCWVRSDFVGNLSLADELIDTTLVYEMRNVRGGGCTGAASALYLWLDFLQPTPTPGQPSSPGSETPPSEECSAEPTIQQVFGFTGADQTFTTPAGITEATVKLWGAGGGGGGGANNPRGGNGGYTTGTLPAGDYTIVVGEGGPGRGETIGASHVYGGGATSENGINGGAGGGLSGVFSVVTSLTFDSAGQARSLAIAGGGGGGAASPDTCGQSGGGGGGATGEAAYACAGSSGGGGGTTSSGGAGGTTLVPGNAGTALRGGGGGLALDSGGGGGGGYFGGGGGAGDSQGIIGVSPTGSGGGGSGYVGGITSAITVAGGAAGSSVPGSSDAAYQTGVGVGGDAGSRGGHGLVVIEYTNPACLDDGTTDPTDPTTPTDDTPTTPECSDDLDNDGDGDIDCDDAGCVDAATNICDPTDTQENQNPVALIIVETEVPADTELTASGSASYDPDGTITDYAWTLTDPSGDVTTATGSITALTPSELGTWTITLTVTDDDGASVSSDPVSVEVVNTPLDAKIVITGNQVNQPVTLDGSSSTPTSGPNAITSWDWSTAHLPSAGGEVPVTVTNSNQSIASFIPSTTGTYRVLLTITDALGNSASEVRLVDITQASPGVGDVQEIE